MAVTFLEDTTSIENDIFGEPETDEESEEDELTPEEDLEMKLDQLPSSASEIASFENDIDHSPGLSWHSELTLYLVPVKAYPGGYALLVLDWDDNYGCWEWRVEAALMGAESINAAKKSLIEKYCEEYFPGSSGNFRHFLKGLM
ncbi:MAG: hypothetical protein HOM79_08830 [Alphaproteobacteria bacterium]|nr:hypothetical protein [Alphaproteobacteria bacterium]